MPKKGKQVTITDELHERLRVYSEKNGFKLQFLSEKAISKYLDEVEPKENNN